MRIMWSDGYVYTPWDQERRERMAEIHRRRWGAPEGHCTIYGQHVPLEHAEPIRFWAQWVACREGNAAATEFVKSHVNDDYARIGRLRELHTTRKEASANKVLIRRIEWEAIHGRD